MFIKKQISMIPQNRNMSFSVIDNSVIYNKQMEHKFGNFTKQQKVNNSSVNSSFLLNPVGYCENPNNLLLEQLRSKEISFCKLDKDKPDYEKLIAYLNSIS